MKQTQENANDNKNRVYSENKRATRFSDILGNEAVIRHFQTALKEQSISHAYLLNGEDGSGKMMLATAFARALQCEEGGIEACGRCKSCMQAASGNHPDISYITHEKSIISVDDIRVQLNAAIQIKPYSAPYRVFVIDEAEKMNEQAQNALLKTLEEPPEYAVILLLVDNENLLLQTILSRVIRLDTRPLSDKVICDYLMKKLSIPDYHAQLSASFACGNLGRALRFASSSEFEERKNTILHLLRHLDEMTTSEVLSSIRPLIEDKAAISDELDLILLWFRDVLILKASQKADDLVYRGEIAELRRYATTRSYSALNRVTLAVETARRRLKANVSAEIVFELLFLTMRDTD